jgi:hypothetical protein
VVIDGSKALAKAVHDVFGRLAFIQRCQVHKTRNVLDQLPENKRGSIRKAMHDAYGILALPRPRRRLRPQADGRLHGRGDPARALR